jgi:hypothetical protein
MDGELGGVTEIAKNTIAARERMASLPLSWHLINKDIPTTVLLDATATKQACNNPRHHSRAKHMETFLAWVRHDICDTGGAYPDSEYSPRRQRG